MLLSVVLPCYNEEQNIVQTVRGVHKWMRQRGIDGEIIVVNDGSKDGSRRVLEERKKDSALLKIVDRPENGGYGVAVRDGCDAAEGEWIVFMDSDGQFDPQDIDRLLARRDEATFITGRRMKRADPLIRNVFGKVLGIANLLVLGLWVRDVNCGMKLFHRDTWRRIRPVQGVEKLFNAAVFLNLKREGIPWLQVDVPHYPRKAGSPTGGSLTMIARTFKELWQLRMAR